jgi:hypothetical protein
MRDWRKARDHRLAIALLLGVVCIVGPATAQQTEPPTLDDLLVQLENNLHHYDTAIPSFLCDEHVVSQLLPSRRDQDTVTDSVFRLKRTVHPNHTINLDESREVKTVNGHPAAGEDLSGPSVLSGAFSGGLAIVSLTQKTCMSYKLQPIKPRHPRDPYIIEFVTVANPENLSDCLLRENGSGRVLIDRTTMQIKRMELNAPNHILTFAGTTPDGRPISPVVGPWAVSVDYAPILLGGRTFWMPSTITSKMTAIPTVWSFKARYSNYHKLEVTSRIVPSTEETAP